MTSPTPGTTTNASVASSTNPDGVTSRDGKPTDTSTGEPVASAPAPTAPAPAPAAGPDAGLNVSQDTFDNPDRALLTQFPTTVGTDGVERIAGPAVDNWKPAAVHATDEQIAEASRREEMFSAAERERRGEQGLEQAPNNPGDGGSNPRTA